MRFAFIHTEKATFSVRALCRLLEVSASGFYAWVARSESRHARSDRQLRARVCASFEASRQRYGSPRIHEDLRDQGLRVSRKRVVRLMQEEGLRARGRTRGRSSRSYKLGRRHTKAPLPTETDKQTVGSGP